MRLEEIMSTEVETVTPTDTLAAATERMSQRRIHHLVVRDDSGLCGVLSSHDLDAVPEGQRGGRTVSELMRGGLVTADKDTLVRKAANLLRGHGVGCLPIVEGNRVVGIVTVSDLLELVGRGAEKPMATAKRWTLKHRGPRQQKDRQKQRV